jgi:sphingomyelin phosphodiesterase acid-like 3
MAGETAHSACGILHRGARLRAAPRKDGRMDLARLMLTGWARELWVCFKGIARLSLLVCCAAGTVPCALAQAKAEKPSSEGAIAALMVSDIHFDPFLDPGKVVQLAGAPEPEWAKILSAASSADREARFAVVDKACPTRGTDTSFALLESSLRAMRKDAAEAKFVTVSGDLLAHSYRCKFDAVFPQAAPGAYREFVEKTLTFVVDELRHALPGTPVYVALGNNDSDCGDYKLDARSAFLAAMAKEIAKDFPPEERKRAEETLAVGGYYSVLLPAPLRKARLLVLDDLFMSAKYSTCGGKPDAGPADEQLAWLKKELAEARSSQEKIWVMAHIPPGVDVYSSAKHLDDVCGEKGPKMFLGSEKLAEVLAAFGDVVQLAVFAHTHMDEVRVLKAPGSGDPANSVAVKMVSSISPINGNAPSFTVARVDAATGGLEDYRVVSASNATGVDTAWQEEYDWGKTFHEAAFSSTGVDKEIAGFRADTGGSSDESGAYIRNFYVGSSPLLALIWPQYVCSLENDSAQAFKACVCPSAH